MNSKTLFALLLSLQLAVATIYVTDVPGPSRTSDIWEIADPVQGFPKYKSVTGPGQPPHGEGSLEAEIETPAQVFAMNLVSYESSYGQLNTQEGLSGSYSWFYSASNSIENTFTLSILLDTIGNSVDWDYELQYRPINNEISLPGSTWKTSSWSFNKGVWELRDVASNALVENGSKKTITSWLNFSSSDYPNIGQRLGISSVKGVRISLDTAGSVSNLNYFSWNRSEEDYVFGPASSSASLDSNAITLLPEYFFSLLFAPLLLM